MPMHVMVDWERQHEEMILVTWQTDDDHGQLAWVVGKPHSDNLDDERRAIEKEIAKETTPFPGSKMPLYRFIVSELLQTHRSIHGSPERPTSIDEPIKDGCCDSLIAAAHALIAAKLDPHEDTAA